jgi:hypothetical protein
MHRLKILVAVLVTKPLLKLDPDADADFHQAGAC